ncbi:MAG: PDZ domain-containing protein [Ruminococcaceae bacterium]|nr:PDZ domain-containing protein [Oscillospiraceae bacterium]
MDEFLGQNTPQNENSASAEQNSGNTSMNTTNAGFNNSQFSTTPDQQGAYQPNGYQQNNAYPTSPNAYNMNPQFNNNQGYQQTPYSTTSQYQTAGFENPVKKKQSKTGKTVFAILIVLCIAVASILIGTSLSGGGSISNGGNHSAQNGEKVDGATPNVEKSPYEEKEYSGKGAMTPTQIYDSVKESNVGILVYYQNQQAGEGSGVIVGEKSGYTYIITCAHVIADKGVDVQVQFFDSSEYDAEIVGIDNKTDIGVVRVKKTGFKAATFGDSDSLKVGTAVYAIGNPGGTEFFGSFTDGIVSALDRPIATSANGYYDLPCVQHTAAINPGNSGGALVNEFGQVIGINSSKIADTEYEDMGFAVPAEKVLEIYKELVENGYVTNRPMLGITYYAVSNDSTYSALAWRNNLPYGSIVIASIATNSSLNETNIKAGDIITGVNGKKLDDTDILLEAIENAKVGDKLTLTVVRLNNSGAVATTFDAEITLVEDKGNTVYQEEVTQQQSQDYYEQFPFNPFGY